MTEILIPDVEEMVRHISLEDLMAFEQRLDDEGLNCVDQINAVGLIDKLCKGMYSRALTLPKGTLVTGKIHKAEYIDIFIRGDVTCKSYLADGSIEETVRLTKFQFLDGRPGRKRVVFAHEESLWITVDPTGAETKEQCECDITVDKISDYNKFITETSWPG